MDTPIRQANKTAQKDDLKRIAVMAMPKNKNPRSRRVKFLILLTFNLMNSLFFDAKYTTI